LSGLLQFSGGDARKDFTKVRVEAGAGFRHPLAKNPGREKRRDFTISLEGSAEGGRDGRKKEDG
jgi:hypothetical protein